MVTRLLPFMETPIFVSSWYTYSIILSLWTIPQCTVAWKCISLVSQLGTHTTILYLVLHPTDRLGGLVHQFFECTTCPHKNPIEITSVVGFTYDSWVVSHQVPWRVFLFFRRRWPTAGGSRPRIHIDKRYPDRKKRWRWAPKLKWSCCPKHFCWNLNRK